MPLSLYFFLFCKHLNTKWSFTKFTSRNAHNKRKIIIFYSRNPRLSPQLSPSVHSIYVFVMLCWRWWNRGRSKMPNWLETNCGKQVQSRSGKPCCIVLYVQLKPMRKPSLRVTIYGSNSLRSRLCNCSQLLSLCVGFFTSNGNINNLKLNYGGWLY